MNLATIERRSVTADMAARFGMETAAFESTIKATIFDGKGTREQFAAFLLVAKQYDLNPLTKEIYAFPGRGGIVPIVSIDGWLKLINSHPQFDGMEFVERHDEKGDLFSVTCSLWRKDRNKPIIVTEYLSECYRNTEPWKMKHRMLRHKTLIQCARYAFGFAGIYDPDEGERIVSNQGHHASHPTPPVPPPLTIAPDSAIRKQLEASVAQIEAEKGGFDFEAYRAALQNIQSNNDADDVWRQFVENANRITEEETEEAQRILNEATTRFWKEEA